MKKASALFAFLVFTFSFSCVYAQKGNVLVKSQQSENTTTQLPQAKKQEVLKQISQIESHLASIETKRNYVLSDPSEKAIAEENGWFESMEKIEERLLKKKEELIKLIKK